MKMALHVLWQTIVLFVVAWAAFIAGLLVPVIRFTRTLIQTPTHTRTYDFDWIIAVLIVYVLLLVIGAARKRLRESVVSATAALVITVAVLTLFTQIGIKDVTL